MTLTVGAKLGPYEILSAIGAGGMGNVYNARDTPRHVSPCGELKDSWSHLGCPYPLLGKN